LKANSLASRADKRQRGFDKVIEEWKSKVADMETELQRSRADNRIIAADVYKFKGQVDEFNSSTEMLRRENNNLNGEIIFFV
jgi:myosin heavy chain 6/7